MTALTSGVSQGSILGPLQFSIFITAIGDDFSSSCSFFADECLELYKKFKRCTTAE